MWVFFLPTGIGLYSNKPHYHLLFGVCVSAGTQRVRWSCLILHGFQYPSQKIKIYRWYGLMANKEINAPGGAE